ncbi:MAG: NAD(+)/NADH kinase [Acidobacteria bacterium]|nr:NAD(+)/NADH kinase [Acidobacteriota bacterium]
MSLPERARRVAVFTKPHPDAPAVLRRVAACLERHGAELLPDEVTAEALGIATSFPRRELGRDADLAVVVGGDGTLLGAARAVNAHETPILGINLGNLGFLTETRCEEVDEVLGAALVGKAAVDPRAALAVTLNDEPPAEGGIALNDVTISKVGVARLFTLSLFVDGEWVTDYRADGLILATPTGSTAYSLSAGGPVVAPDVDALLVAPICPHSLSQRPLVLPGRARVTIELPEGQRADGVQVTLDGQVDFPIAPGDTLRVAHAAHGVRLVRPTRRSFFSLLRDKLGWGQR